jgi:glutamine---fructose-6-phosphate transaminase (isomerizing)
MESDMCGIIAVLRRPPSRPVPSPETVLGSLDRALAAVAGADLAPVDGEGLAVAAAAAEEANRLLLGVPGLLAVLREPTLRSDIPERLERLDRAVLALEGRMDRGEIPVGGVETVNATLIRLRDASWAIARDRLRTAGAVAALAGGEATDAALGVWLSVQQALSALDRLEVRGRDSAGLHLLIRNPAVDGSDPAVRSLLERRSADPLFRSGSVRLAEGGLLSVVVKAAAEIGELGDNTRVLRQALATDELLRRALMSDSVEAVVVGHTRWASVGIISEPNAHPLNSEQDGGGGEPYVVGVLNGDVDNFADLIAADGLRIPADITTDAKVIPTMVAARLAEGHDLDEAFRRTVASFEGSVAITTCAGRRPDQLQLALRGSGQALYVGLAEDAFVVASEPYGVVEETARYLRLDGETPGNPANPNASRGQLVLLDTAGAGEVAGIDRRAYDGTPLPVTEEDLTVAEVTTRDIDRGDHPHFLLKEISESPTSFRKTLRGKLVEDGGSLAVRLGPETIAPEVRTALAEGRVARILVIGQGTAAVAGQSVALAIGDELASTPIRVEALPATELSGFRLRSDMRDTLVVAISQSGTTTDTNRTVDLVRSRGAAVIAIVNRRNSDLTDKADGVLYTSDGRDVEMSVASTKAFYSQVAAGFLLAVALADAAGAGDGGAARQELLASLRAMPDAMERTLARRPEIARAAREHAPQRRYWAVVGNGPNLIAARELRIKLSELCYKSIACDATEDKKHIDLSSEPLILLCAAGLVGSNADDVAKEVAIYRAHKAAPIVIADEGETRFGAALELIVVPSVHPRLAFVLSTVVGHLFGYEAARAIDALAMPLREVRAAIEQAAASGLDDRGTEALRRSLEAPGAQFFDALRSGLHNGQLEASTAVRLASLLRYALGAVSLESYQLEFGRVGTPSRVLDDLVSASTLAIEELTRPIDAIKHQAKTVTVGISRADETLLEVPLARAVMDAGAARDRLSYRSLRTLADVDPAVVEVLGWTRYRIEGLEDEPDRATLVIVDRGGISRGIPSRADRDPGLRGTKRRVATEREVLIARGARDGRTIVLVPEVKDNVTTGLTLLHVRLADRLPTEAVRGVLQGYRNRLAELRDAVTETEPTFRDDLLADLPVVELLTEPVGVLATAWRT